MWRVFLPVPRTDPSHYEPGVPAGLRVFVATRIESTDYVAGVPARVGKGEMAMKPVPEVLVGAYTAT